MQTENNIKSQLVGGKSVGYLQSVALEQDLNLGPPDYKSGAPAGLSLRGGGRGFPPVTKNVASSVFHRKIKEKWNQKKFLAVCFSAYLLYLSSNLKS